jgi:hypothetical protein
MSVSGCDSFQKRWYTEAGDDTSLKVLYELCLKQQKQSDCNKLQEAITPNGKFNGYKNCKNWKKTPNGKDDELSCSKLFDVPVKTK